VDADGSVGEWSEADAETARYQGGNTEHRRQAILANQFGNLLFGEQVECEVARQIGEGESDARVCQRACALACGGYVAGSASYRAL